MTLSRAARRRLPILVVTATVVLTSACIHRFYQTDVRSVVVPDATRTDTIRSPVKVHLADGSTVIFRDGARVNRDRISGTGERYALMSPVATATGGVPMDSVVGVESFEGKLLALPTIAVSLAATAAGAVALAGLAVALFGSCPTVYADTGAGPVLQAEGFSYAIAPLMEHRDLDPLRVRPDADGTVRLELRNEALETHFINHIELVAVQHAAGARVVPDQHGRTVEVGAMSRLERGTDRAGRDVTPVLKAADGELFASDPTTIARSREGDLDDWIDLDIAGLPAGDSIAVVLRLRNSLLSTILLYEGMLGGRDAIDWMTSDLQHIATTVDVSRWYIRTMGMRATVDGVPTPLGQPFEGTARLADIGPIAFRDVAIVLPRPARDAPTARVRLRFVADNWRIDEIQVSGHVSRPSLTTVAVGRVIVDTPAVGGGPMLDSAAVRAIAEPDDQYLETRPGQRMRLEFAPPRPAPDAGTVTTYLLAWQGWYREWIRGPWLAEPKRSEPFVPGDAAVRTALTRWTEQQASFERAFYSSMIPVR